jgi:integrase
MLIWLIGLKHLTHQIPCTLFLEHVFLILDIFGNAQVSDYECGMLTMEQVAKLICAPKNLKHRLMLITTCSAGLRASEVMALKTEHIDSERMLIKVKDARVKKIDIDCFLKNCWASCACITKITDPKLTRSPHRLKKGKINPYLTKRCAAFIKKPAKRPE